MCGDGLGKFIVFFSFPRNYFLLLLDRSFAKWRAVIVWKEREGLSRYGSTRSLIYTLFIEPCLEHTYLVLLATPTLHRD